MISYRQLIACGLALAALTSFASAQGALVDVRANHAIRLPRPIHCPPHDPSAPPTASYQIEVSDVNAKLTDRVARVQGSQFFENTGSVQLEACFMFPLTYDGAIHQLTLLVDGKEYYA